MVESAATAAGLMKKLSIEAVAAADQIRALNVLFAIALKEQP